MKKKQYILPQSEVTNLGALGSLMKIGDGNSPVTEMPPGMATGNAPRRTPVF